MSFSDLVISISLSPEQKIYEKYISIKDIAVTGCTSSNDAKSKFFRRSKLSNKRQPIVVNGSNNNNKYNDNSDNFETVSGITNKCKSQDLFNRNNNSNVNNFNDKSIDNISNDKPINNYNDKLTQNKKSSKLTLSVFQNKNTELENRLITCMKEGKDFEETYIKVIESIVI